MDKQYKSGFEMMVATDNACVHSSTFTAAVGFESACRILPQHCSAGYRTIEYGDGMPTIIHSHIHEYIKAKMFAHSAIKSC